MGENNPTLESNASQAKQKSGELSAELTNAIDVAKDLYDVASVAFGFVKQAIDASNEYEKSRKSLTDALGSEITATRTLNEIRHFSYKAGTLETDDLIGAYIKLSKSGLQPTMEQMRQIGDLASSQGKSITQYADAIIDAGKGHFRHLKDFEITASKSGDKVKLTFHGVTKTVNNSAKEIQAAILSLGNLKGVVGTMDRVSTKWVGMVSTLQKFIKEVSRGFGEKLQSILMPVLKYFTDGKSGLERVRIAVIALSAAFGVVLVAAAIAAGMAIWAAITPLLPFIPIAAKIVAAFIAVWAIIKDFSAFMDGKDSFFEKILQNMGFSPEVIERYRSAFTTGIKAIQSLIKGLGSFFGDMISEKLKKFWEDFKSFAILIASIIMFLISLPVIFVGVWVDLYNRLPAIKAAFKQSLSDLGEELKKGFLKLGDIIGDAIMDALRSKQATWIRELLNTAIDGLNYIIGLASKYFPSIDLAPIEHIKPAGDRATGGPVEAGKIYRVAEKGEGEFIVPGRHSTVIPLSKAGGRSSVTFNFGNIIVHGNSSAEIAKNLKGHLMSALDSIAPDLAARSGLAEEF